MSDGISPNKLNDLSKVYLDQINTFREIRKQETAQDIERWSQPAKDALQQEEVQVDEEKKALPKLKMYRKAGNLARAGDEKSMKRQTKMVSVLNKETSKGYKKAALDKLRDGGSPKHQSESFSDWRIELREISDAEPETEKKAEKEVTEKKVKNIIKINPTLPEAVAEIGGELISVEEQTDGPTPSKEEPGMKAKEKRAGMIKKQVLIKKLQAVRAGAGADIVASYDPIEAATEYLYEEGLNEEGIDLLIEEIGLDGFVEFVEGSAVELNEERAARRANVKAKSYADVKASVDKADAAKKKAKKGEYAPSYAKKETDVTVYDDKAPAKKKAVAKKAPAAMKKAVSRKKAVLTQPVKKGGAIVKAKSSAIVKAVTKVKKAQPAKKATKQGLGDKIRTAYKKGVERHKASVGKAKTEVGKVVKTAKTTAKQHSKHRKDFVSGISPTAREKKIAKGVGGAVKKALTREELELLEKGVKEEVGISSAAAIEKAKKEAKLQKKEAEAVKKVKKEEYTVTAADQKGNTPAWQAYKAKRKNVKTGKPLYKAASHVKEEKKKGLDGKECWDGYKLAGTKKKGGKTVDNCVKEDKAFQNVGAALRKKPGESGVLTKDSPKPKSKPLDAKQIWKRDDENAVQREIDARYGGAANRKAGRGLGT